MMLGEWHFEGDEDLQWRVCALLSRDKRNVKISCRSCSKDCWWLKEGELKVKGDVRK
jgi:hypothetical protein